MNVPKVDELDYINFLIAAQRVFSTVEAAKVSPEGLRQPAHDAYTRLLQRTPPDSTARWHEVQPLVKRKSGVLVIDDNLKGYGWIKVFRTVGTNGDAEYWATSKLDMTIQQAADLALDAWQIEVYHQGLKQFTGIEPGQFRLEMAQRNHISLAIRAFVRLEVHRLRRQGAYFEAKTAIIRDAIRAYLAHPTFVLPSTA